MARFVRQRNSQKWGEFTRDAETHVMTLADMDLPLYEPLRELMVERVRGANSFTYKNISKECYGSIIEWYQKRHLASHAPELRPEHILDSPSLLNVLYLLTDTLTAPDDGVLLLTPVYNYYDRIARFLKRRVVESWLHESVSGNEVSYDINFTNLEERAKSCKIMIFCNPHNPSGRVWNRREVERVVAICQQHDILIISDEILSDLIPARHRRNFYSMANCAYPRIVVCNSISKSFNVESLRAGYAIIRDPTLNAHYSQLLSQLNLYNNEFAMMCTEAFYSPTGLQWIDHALAIIHSNYQYLLQRIQGTLLLVSELQAAFIITINFDPYLKFIERWQRQRKGEKPPPKHIVSYFLKENGIKGIEMIYGNGQGLLTSIRLAIAIEEDLFVKFADKLRACVLELEYEYRQPEAKL